MPEGTELKLSESDEAGPATDKPDQPGSQSKGEIKMRQFKSEARLGKQVKLWIVLQLLAYAALNAAIQTKAAVESSWEKAVELEAGQPVLPARKFSAELVVAHAYERVL